MAIAAAHPRSAERIEPHNIDAEQSVLGACLLDRDVIVRLAPQLIDGDFLRDAHRVIWQAMTALYIGRVPIDMVTLSDELRRAGTLDRAGGEAYLAELIAATPTAVHGEYYAGIVRDASVRRQLIAAAKTIAGAAWDESLDLPMVIERAETALDTAAATAGRTEYLALGDVMTALYQRIDQPAARVVPTGVGPLDDVIGGVLPGQLVVVAARPGSGKTALAVQMASQQARRGTAVGFISLEMRAGEVGERLIGMHSGVNMHRVRAGIPLSDEQRTAVTRAFGVTAEMPVYFPSSTSNRYQDVIAAARTLHERRGITLLVVDYLQLMFVAGVSRGANRAQEVGQMSAGLKALALELGITIVCLSQLSRASEHRNPPVPILSDLRESGSIEQDADIVVLIHRDDLYDKALPEGQSQLIIAKHRNGPVGTRHTRFVPHTSQFLRLEG